MQLGCDLFLVKSVSNFFGSLLTCASTVQRSVKHEWLLIITHSFHVKITLQYYFSSGKENEGHSSLKFVITLTVKAIFIKP